MTDLEELATVEFPRSPRSILSNDEARSAIVKASAYLTFALEESHIEHDRGLEAAMLTDATYNLEEDRTPKEYIELSIQELAYAEGCVDDESFKNDLQDFRTTLKSAIN